MKLSVKIFLFVFIALTIQVVPQKKLKNDIIKAKQEYFDMNLDSAKSMFLSILEKDSTNIEILCYLANIHRINSELEPAVNILGKVLKIDKYNSMAYAILGDIYNPQFSFGENADYETAYNYYRIAVENNPKNGNAYLGLLIESMRRNLPDAEKTILNTLYENEFFTPKTLAYNRTILGALPQNAILLVNGDLDTFPILALQSKESFRTDVAVINASMLNSLWYSDYISKKYGVRNYTVDSLTFESMFGINSGPSDKLVDSLKADFRSGRIIRPLAFAFTLDGKYYGKDDFFSYDLFFYLLIKDSTQAGYNFSNIEKFYKNFNIKDFQGDVASKYDFSPLRHSGNLSGFIDNNIISYPMNIAYHIKNNDVKGDSEFYLNFTEKYYKKLKFYPEDYEKILQAVKEIKAIK